MNTQVLLKAGFDLVTKFTWHYDELLDQHNERIEQQAAQEFDAWLSECADNLAARLRYVPEVYRKIALVAPVDSAKVTAANDRNDYCRSEFAAGMGLKDTVEAEKQGVGKQYQLPTDHRIFEMPGYQKLANLCERAGIKMTPMHYTLKQSGEPANDDFKFGVSLTLRFNPWDGVQSMNEVANRLEQSFPSQLRAYQMN